MTHERKPEFSRVTVFPGRASTSERAAASSTKLASLHTAQIFGAIRRTFPQGHIPAGNARFALHLKFFDGSEPPPSSTALLGPPLSTRPAHSRARKLGRCGTCRALPPVRAGPLPMSTPPPTVPLPGVRVIVEPHSTTAPSKSQPRSREAAPIAAWDRTPRCPAKISSIGVTSSAGGRWWRGRWRRRRASRHPSRWPPSDPRGWRRSAPGAKRFRGRSL